METPGRPRPARAGVLLVIAKEPVAGRVKTRLQSRFTPQVAAELAAASLGDTLHAANRSHVRHRALALDGAPGPWVPAGVDVLPQRGAGLDERLAAAFDDAFGRYGCSSPVLLIGMDTPQVDPAVLGGDVFAGADAVLGPAADGGFWAVGLREPRRDVLLGVPMSRADTGAEQLRRLRAGGLRVRLLPELRDVDTPDDARAVATAAPATRFAQRFLNAEADLEAHVPAPRTGLRVPAVRLFEEALAGERVWVEGSAGRFELPAATWAADAGPVDELLLARCRGPVLDLGCGPGRLVGELTRRGVPALGIDISGFAVELAGRRGARVLRRDLRHRLPAEGSWTTVLLADGNIGIGGHPDRLLARCADLLADGGSLVVDVDPGPDVDEVDRVLLRSADGERYAHLDWARTGARALVRHAAPHGLVPAESWEGEGRTLVVLRRLERPAGVGYDRAEPSDVPVRRAS